MKSKGYYLLGLFLTGFSIPVFLLYGFLMTLAILIIDERTADSSFLKILTHPATLAFFVLSMLVFPIVTFIHYHKNKKLDKLEFIIIDILRFVVALLMFYYGFVKIANNFFDYTYKTLDSRVCDVNSFELTWYYFGKNNFQVLLIGFMELIPAILLLFRRTYFLGIVLILPVAGNVLWTNIFNSVSGLTYIVSFIIMLLSCYILYSKKTEIIDLFSRLSQSKKSNSKYEFIISQVFKALTILIIVSYTIFSFVRVVRHHNKVPTLKQGAFELTSLYVNHNLVVPKEDDSTYYKTIYIESQARWNSILFFSKEYNSKQISIRWNEKNDSVVSYLKQQNAVENDEVIEESKFVGTYTFTDSNLTIQGIQGHDTIEAIYKKKNLQKQKWYW